MLSLLTTPVELEIRAKVPERIGWRLPVTTRPLTYRNVTTGSLWAVTVDRLFRKMTLELRLIPAYDFRVPPVTRVPSTRMFLTVPSAPLIANRYWSQSASME